MVSPVPILSFFLLLCPSTLSPSPPLRFPPTILPTSWSNPDLCHLTLMSPCRARCLPGDPRPDRMSRLSRQQQMNQALNTSPDWLPWVSAIIPNSGAPQSCSAFLFRHYWHIITEQAVQIQAGFIRLNLKYISNPVRINCRLNFVTMNECENEKNCSLTESSSACLGWSLKRNTTQQEKQSEEPQKENFRLTSYRTLNAMNWDFTMHPYSWDFF